MFRQVHTSPHLKRAAAFAAACLIGATSVPATVLPLYARAEETADSTANDASSSTASTRKAKDTTIIEVREALPENYSWINDYAYTVNLSEDGTGTITLLRCAAVGDETVYGCALIDNIPYQIVIAKRCFTECPGLTSLTFEAGCGLSECPEEAKTMKAVAPADSSRLFAGNTSLASLDVSGLDFSATEDISSLAEGDEALVSFTSGNMAPGSAIPGASVSAAAMFKNCKSLPVINLAFMDASNLTSMASMFLGCSAASKIKFGETFNTSRVTDMSNMFAGDRTVKEFSFGPAFDTSSVTDMSGMFAGTTCALSLKDFDTSNVVSMANMFRDRMGSEDIDLRSFNTANVEDMSYMFAVKYGNPVISFSENWSVANVTNAEGMFSGFGRTEDGEAPGVDITFEPFASRFRFARPISLKNFFQNSGFTAIDLRPWAGVNITDCAYMFENSKYLKSVSLQDVNMGNVQSMSHMFAECPLLEKVTALEKFTSQSCRRFDYMFYNCSSIKDLTMHEKNFSKALYMDHMFYGCDKAEIVNISDINTIDFNRLITAEDFDGPNGYLSLNRNIMYYSGARYPDRAASIKKSACNGLPDAQVSVYPYYHVTDSRGLDQYEPVYEETPMTAHILCQVDYQDDREGYKTENFVGPLALCNKEILTTCINHVSAEDATDEIRATWFCPNDHINPKTKKPYTTNNNVDTNYYEIYGGSNDDKVFVYNPTQDEWNKTYNACTFASIPTTETVKDASGNPKIIVKAPDRFLIYGMDISANPGHSVTLNAPAYNMTGDSGISHIEDTNPSDYPVFPAISERSFVYGNGHEGEHKIPALKQKGFRFLGWYDQNNKKVSGSDGSCIPDGKTNQVLTPRFQIRESKILLSAGTIPEGFDEKRTGIRVKPGQEKLWHGKNGTYYAVTTVGDGLFALPEAIIPPVKSDETLANMEAWHDDNGFLSDGVQGTAVLKNYVFDHEQIFPNFSASWTTEVMTEKERAGLSDELPENQASGLVDNIDPENPDPAAVERAEQRYKNMTEEEKASVTEEELTILNQARALVDQKKLTDDANQRADDAEQEKAAAEDEAKTAKDEAEQAKNDAIAARAEAEKAHEEAMASKAEAELKVAEAEAKAEQARKEAEEAKAAAAMGDNEAAAKLIAAESSRQEAIEKQKEAEAALAKAEADLENAQKEKEAAEAANKTLSDTNANLTDDNAALKAENEELKEENESLLTANGHELKDAKDEIADLKKQLSDANAALDALKKEGENTGTTSQETEELQKELAQAKADLAAAKEEAAKNKAEAETAKQELVKAQAEAEAAKKEAQEAKKEAEEAASGEALEEAKKETASLKKQVKTLQAQLETARDEAEEAKAEAKTAKSQLTAAQSEAKKAKSEAVTAIAQLATAQNEAKTAKAQLTSAQNEARTAKAQLSTAQNETKTAKAQLTSAQNEAKTAKAQLTSAQNEAKTAKAQLSTAQNEAKTAKAQLTSAQNEAKTAKAQLATAQAETKKAKAEAEAAKAAGDDSEEVADLTRRNAALTKELASTKKQLSQAKANTSTNSATTSSTSSTSSKSKTGSATSSSKTGTNSTYGSNSSSSASNSAKNGNTYSGSSNTGSGSSTAAGGTYRNSTSSSAGISGSSSYSGTSGYRASAGSSDASDTDASANDEFMMSWLEEDEGADSGSTGSGFTDSSSAGTSYNEEGSYTYFTDEDTEDSADTGEEGSEDAEDQDTDSEPDKATSGFGSETTEDNSGASPVVLVFLLIGAVFTSIAIVLTVRKNKQENARRKAPAPKGRR